MPRLDSDSRFTRIFLEGWRPYAWIAVVGVLLYIKSLGFGFCYFDDQDLIVGNESFLSNALNIFKAFAMKVYPKSLTTSYYRPLLIVSFIINAQMGGISPFVYHLTNIVIHLIVSSLVFTFFLKLGYRRTISFFFALVFTVHPVLSQAVAWVPGRNDTMLAAFIVASFIFLINFMESRRPRDYSLHLLFFLLAIFTKESAVILLVMSFFYIVIVRGRDMAVSIWKPLVCGYFVVCAAWFIPRYFVIKGSEPVTIYDLWNLIILQLPAVAQLIGKALWPVNQSVFPVMRESPTIYGIVAIVFVMLMVVFGKKGSRKLIYFGAVWLVLFLIPPLIRSHAPSINDVLEHRMYLPIIGLMIILMDLDIFRDGSAVKKRALVYAGTLVVCLLFIKTYVYIDNFRNATVFWEGAVAASPHSSFARLKLAEVYYRDDRIDEALERFLGVMRSDFFATYAGHYYVGHIYLKKGNLADAEKEFRKTLVLMPDNDWAAMSLGVVYHKAGKSDAAEAMWKRSLAVNPDNREAAKNLAVYYVEKGDLEAARYYLMVLRRQGVEPPAEFLKKAGQR